jgi:hypothetical protein
MIASSNNAAQAILGLVFVLCGASASAQAPVQLLPPPTQAAPTTAPAVPAAEPGFVTPPAQSPSTPFGTTVLPQQNFDTPSERPRRAASGIRGEELRAPDANGAGTLDETKGGFGLDMWEGTSPLLVQRLLPSLPAMTASPIARGLQRRLLLSIAAPPQAQDGDRTPPLPLVKLRVERLFAMGEAEGLLQLLDVVPSRTVTPEMQRLKLDALLLVREPDAACAEARSAQRTSDAFWGKLRVFCSSLAGRGDEAQLALEVLRDQGQSDPIVELTAATLLKQSAPAITRLPQPNPLALAMLKAAKRPIPTDAAQVKDPALLKAIALSEGPVETRIAAAEQAEALGVIDTGSLREIYGAVTFTQNELELPLSADRGARARALLYRAVQLPNLPSTRGDLILRALNAARDQGYYPTMARVLAPNIAAIRPAAELATLAGPFARSLYAAGDYKNAGAWLTQARQAGATNQEATAWASRLWPLQRLTEPDDDKPLPKGALAAWRKATAEGPPDVAERRAAIMYGLLDAMGHDVGAEDWLSLMSETTNMMAPVSRPAMWHGLRVATEKLRLGETVLLSLLTMGDGGPGALEPTSLYRVIASLRLIGLDAEARALAIEAAIANGV